MSHHLHIFPGTSCPAIGSLSVALTRSGRTLCLTYMLEGDVAAIRLPAPVANAITSSSATENLWQHSCFELFFRRADDGANRDAYHEYNFAPSLNWDHYQFSATRTRIEQAAKTAPRLRVINHTATHYIYEAQIELPGDWPDDAALQANLTAVIETQGGDKTYWALSHPNTQPDFHDPRGFTLTI